MSMQQTDDRLDGIDRIVVDADDVLETMRRDKRDKDRQRTHVFRVGPPFEGDVTATTFVSEAHTYYPPEMDPKPIHLGVGAFILGNSYGVRHPDWRNIWNYPDISASRSRFRDHYDVTESDRPIEDDDELADKWDEWWDKELEVWEQEVRHRLDNIDNIHFEDFDVTVPVRIE